MSLLPSRCRCLNSRDDTALAVREKKRESERGGSRSAYKYILAGEAPLLYLVSECVSVVRLPHASLSPLQPRRCAFDPRVLASSGRRRPSSDVTLRHRPAFQGEIWIYNTGLLTPSGTTPDIGHWSAGVLKESERGAGLGQAGTGRVAPPVQSASSCHVAVAAARRHQSLTAWLG